MMIDLLAADVQRITARPLARALVGMFIMLIAVVGVIVFVRSAKHPFNPPVGFRNGLGGAATPLALAGFILGASLFGADYTTRALTTLLTWEPRRSRVLAAQATASAAVTAGASLALLALLTISVCSPRHWSTEPELPQPPAGTYSGTTPRSGRVRSQYLPPRLVRTRWMDWDWKRSTTVTRSNVRSGGRHRRHRPRNMLSSWHTTRHSISPRKSRSGSDSRRSTKPSRSSARPTS